MPKFLVSYDLPYRHRVTVGVTARSAAQASKKAEEAFDACTIWDNTKAMPLLSDSYDEDGGAGEPLEFIAEPVTDFPKEDGTVRHGTLAAAGDKMFTALDAIANMSVHSHPGVVSEHLRKAIKLAREAKPKV